MFAGKELDEIITEGPEGLRFISGGSGIAKLVNLDKEQVRRLVNKLSELEGMADVIIIDTGAGISPAVMEFLVASPETILVTTPEPTSITDSYAPVSYTHLTSASGIIPYPNSSSIGSTLSSETTFSGLRISCASFSSCSALSSILASPALVPSFLP